MLLEEGLIRKYLEQQAQEGAREARRELRKKHGRTFSKELVSWELLDDSAPLCADGGKAAVGYEHYHHIGEDPWTPERLIALGDKQQANGFEAEQKRILEDAERRAA